MDNVAKDMVEDIDEVEASIEDAEACKAIEARKNFEELMSSSNNP